MLRALTISFLILVLTTPLLLRNYAIISFFVNRDTIATELCEKREVKNDCCKGSCVLKKEMEKTKEVDHKLPTKLLNKDLIFVVTPKEDILWISEVSHRELNSFYLVSLAQSEPDTLEHPPCA